MIKEKISNSKKKKSTKRFWALACAIHDPSATSNAAILTGTSSNTADHKNDPPRLQTGHIASKGKPVVAETFLEKNSNSKIQRTKITTSQLRTFMTKQGNIARGLSADGMVRKSSQKMTPFTPKIPPYPKMNNEINFISGKRRFIRRSLPPSPPKSINFQNLRPGLRNYIQEQEKERKAVINHLNNRTESERTKQKLPDFIDRDGQKWMRENLKGKIASTAVGLTSPTETPRSVLSKTQRSAVNQVSEFIQRSKYQGEVMKGTSAPNNSPSSLTRTLKYPMINQTVLSLKDKNYGKVEDKFASDGF